MCSTTRWCSTFSLVQARYHYHVYATCRCFQSVDAPSFFPTRVRTGCAQVTVSIDPNSDSEEDSHIQCSRATIQEMENVQASSVGSSSNAISLFTITLTFYRMRRGVAGPPRCRAAIVPPQWYRSICGSQSGSHNRSIRQAAVTTEASGRPIQEQIMTHEGAAIGGGFLYISDFSVWECYRRDN